ncbi:MAG: hypothetical protein A2857_00625 [Candidatus Levybacteria bacterium RIFCSPHIGHO2_01_FULL_36_15]|nr:MAG: hypothetical protein A2857_00625 [Candidatus Levybacteria bacterium RIFCSPHIGHO2_01_FULL_36_15]OGH38755.1 MAG: hypothetical protein A2905_06255 [Candidatus Levybacteria bacterium RIFCSPLOWO2_01_FULL_36_10]
MKNIWQSRLGGTKPILIQAPMEGVTDTVFRQVISKCGKPDLFFTEFTNVSGLISEKGHDSVAKRLKFSPLEKPIIAQVWGNNPQDYEKAAKLIIHMGFDGIDINMGCPDRKVVKKGSCSGLINNPKLASEIIKMTKKGAGGNLPVSVKTRLGYNKIQTEEWIGFLLKFDLDAITIHGRFSRQMSRGDADWEEIGKAVRLRDKTKSKTLIIGNGDIKTIQEAQEKYEKYLVDGVMIGRAIFKNIFLFDKNIDSEKVKPKEKLQLLLDHLALWKKTWGDAKNFSDMKKFYKIYVSGFPEASDFRNKLVQINSIEEAISTVSGYIKTFL